MDKQRFFLITSLIILVLTFQSCKGVGIFSYIAATDVIDEGLLLEGLKTSKVVQISNEYDTNYYDYFTSGTSLYRRNTQDRSNSKVPSWVKVSLPAGGWTNIQSMAVSNDNILLALARKTSSSIKVGLFFYNDSAGFQEIAVNDDLTGSSSAYKTVLLYCPDPEDNTKTFYVNILNHSGSFGRTDTNFTGSELYTIADADTDWKSKSQAAAKWTNYLQSSYISSTAHNAGIYLFTLINPKDSTGLLVNENGEIVTDSTTTPSTALTWLPEVSTGSTQKGAFIMSSTKLSGSNYKIFISNWEAKDWKSINSGYVIASFLDVSNTRTGASDKIILAGTQSNPSSTKGNGYLEIVAKDSDPEKWSIRSNKANFKFAEVRSYMGSKLSQQSVIGLSQFKDNKTADNFVYASTASDAIWKINPDSTSPSVPAWKRE